MLFIDSMFLLENSPLWLIPGLALLLYGGKLLLDGAIGLARTLGISPLLIGFTIVAFGTSAPELGFSIQAASHGDGGLLFGNIVGSNVANIALVLGIAAMVRSIPVAWKKIGKEMWLLLGVTSVFGILALHHGSTVDIEGPQFRLSRVDGIILLLCFVGFTGWMIQQGIRHTPQEDTSPSQSLVRSLLFTIMGIILLVAGAVLTHGGAVSLVESSGLSQSLVGFFAIGLATSSPEIVTTVLACRRGMTDLAIGNIVGSNIFNLLLIFGLSAVIMDDPMVLAAENNTHLGFDMGAMFIATGMLFIFIRFLGKNIIDRREGIALVVMYLGYAMVRACMELSIF